MRKYSKLHIYFILSVISVASILFIGCSDGEKGAIEEIHPITVVDALGRELIFETVPQKIATISPTATEILYSVEGTSILRDRSSNFPDEVRELPHVGSAYDPSIEALVKEKPDLVIIEALTQARFASILGQSGLKVMAVKAETIDEIKEYMLKVGKLIGKEELASEKISGIEARLSDLGSFDDRSILILISDQDRNLYAAKPESYSGLIPEALGMKNKAEGLPDSGPYPGFSMMSTEAILVANPEVIVTITPAPKPAPRLSTTIAQIPPFSKLTAVQNGNVIEADVALFLQAPGPRIVEAIEFLKSALTK